MDDTPPPAYDFKQVPPYTNQEAPSSSSATILLQPVLPPSSLPPSALILCALLHSHHPIGIYHAGTKDLRLALSADSPSLMHITIHTLLTPSIALHASHSPASPVLATAQYNFLSAADITVLALPPSTTTSTAALERTGYFPDAWSFSMWVPRTGGGRGREALEWKHSHGEEVQELQGRSRGLKCVRAGTGEVVMVYTRPAMGGRKLAKFQWVSGEEWGVEGYLMVLVTLLAVVERIRGRESGGD